MIKHAHQPVFSFHDFARLLFQNRKRAGMYGLIFIFISFNLCLFLPANMQSPKAETLVNSVQLFCFAMMGVINVWFFYKRNFLAELFFSGAKLAFILLLFILIAFVLFVYYYVSGNNGLIMAFASSSAFLLPFIIYQGWKEFMSIPEKKFPAWHLPVAEINNNVSSSSVNTMQVQLKVCRKENDIEYHLFPVTVSAKVRLGRVFERFIADQGLQPKARIIETENKQQHPFAWEFYEEKWYGFYSRNLNPLRSLAENNIKPNSKILIVRTA